MVYGNPLDTKMLINEGQCTIVAEFLRRVQAVIWNRSLMRTSNNHLGLVPADAKVGDHICVFYGCSVPAVVLRREVLNVEMQREEEEQLRQQELAAAARTLQKQWKRQRDRKHIRTVSLTVPNSPTGSSMSHLQPLIPPKPERLRPRNMEEERLQNGIPTKMVASNRETENETVVDRTRGDGTNPEETTAQNAPTRGSISSEVASDTTEPRQESVHEEPIPANDENTAPAGTVDENETSKSTPVSSPPTHAQATAPEITINGMSDKGTMTEEDGVAAKPGLEGEGPPKKYFWRMVGECYVHGMMDGEAIAWQNNNEVKAEIFDLR